MQTSDRSRIVRSVGLAVAALLLVGGAVFGSNAFNGGSHKSDNSQPSASANVNDDHGRDVSESPDASESPEASANETAGEDVNDDNDTASPEASDPETAVENESEAPDASGSPDEHGGDSGQGGGDDSNAK